MESAIVSLICIAVILSGGLMLAQSAVVSIDSLSVEWKAMERRSTDITNTVISATNVTDQGSSGLDVKIKNAGQMVLGNFSKWDVLALYSDDSSAYYIKHLTYVSGTSPGNDQWAVNSIEWNGSAEVYEKGLLNPLEDLKIRLKPNPGLGTGKSIFVVVATDSGIKTSIQFAK